MAIHKIEERHFVEDIALFFEQMGLPRMGGRVLGVLLISDPEIQSLTGLAEALQASKSAISSATRLLLEADLIERVPGPVTRQEYFRFRDDGWARFMRQRFELMGSLHQITERGLALMQEKSADLQTRLKTAHDMFSFMEDHYGEWLQQWREQKAALLAEQSKQTS